MRTITLICALLLLASCGGSPEAQKRQEPAKKDDFHATSNADSSPIIISDGSIRITHKNPDQDHFRVRGQKHAVIKLQNHQPYTVGYRCNAGVDCVSKCPYTAGSPSTPTTACYVDVVANVTDWKLVLCEGGASSTCAGSGTVQMKWDANPDAKGNVDYESIVIKSNDQDFKVKEANATTGAELQHSSAPGTKLRNSTLTLTRAGTPETYYLDCVNYNPCLTLDYSCYVSGNAKCGGN